MSPGALLYISLAFGFSLAVCAWVFFRISGGLFNPAVALGLALIGCISYTRLAVVFIAQILGAIASAAVVSALFPQVCLLPFRELRVRADSLTFHVLVAFVRDNLIGIRHECRPRTLHRDVLDYAASLHHLYARSREAPRHVHRAYWHRPCSVRRSLGWRPLHRRFVNRLPHLSNGPSYCTSMSLTQESCQPASTRLAPLVLPSSPVPSQATTGFTGLDLSSARFSPFTSTGKSPQAQHAVARS
jgi:hypothetical protein